MVTQQNGTAEEARNRLSKPGPLVVTAVALIIILAAGRVSILPAATSYAATQSTVVFDFDTGSPPPSLYQNTPFDYQTPEGVTAHFSSPSDFVAPAFSVQSTVPVGYNLSMFSGQWLYDNQQSRDYLDIRFNAHLYSINLTFATIEPHGGPGVEPCYINLTAYMDSVGTDPIGWTWARGVTSSEQNTQGTLSFDSRGQPFNLARIWIPYQPRPMSVTDFFVDHIVITATPSPDATPPVTTISLSGTLGNQGWYKSDVTISLSATDDVSGVNKIEYGFDGTAWTTYVTSFSLNTDGTISVYYKSTDNAGNVEEVKTQVVKIDKVSPITTSNLSGVIGNNGWYTSTVTVTLSASDGVSGVATTEYSFDNTIWMVYAAPFIVSNQGTNLVYYNSTDVAGNAETVKTQTVKVDSASPLTAIALSGVPGDVTVTLSATDSVSEVYKTEYSLDNATWIVYTTSFTVTDPAITAVYYRSTDMAGNVEAVKTKTITGDNTPPITTISLSGVSGDQGWYISNVEVSISATDDWSGVAEMEFSFDNNAWTTYTISFSITNEGTTVVYYRSTDAIGNIENTLSQTVKIDKTIPAGSIVINGDASSTTSTSVTLTLTSNDAFSGVFEVRYSNDGVWDTEPWEAPSATKTWTLAAGYGAKVAYYQIMDNAGWTSATYQDSIVLEAIPPIAPQPATPLLDQASQLGIILATIAIGVGATAVLLLRRRK